MTTTDERLSIGAATGGRRWIVGLGLAGIGGAGLFWLMGLAGIRLHVHAPDTALLAAQPFAIKFHLATVLSAFLIGCILMAGAKGARLHRALGWSWVILMVSTSIASFFIHTLNKSGFSPIHALSAWVLVAAPFGLYLARRHKVAAHRRMMTGLFLFGLLLAGAFTFIPGRLMFDLFFR